MFVSIWISGKDLEDEDTFCDKLEDVVTSVKRNGVAIKGRLHLKFIIYSTVHALPKICCTVEPRFNEPPFNEVLDITNDILCPSQKKETAKAYYVTDIGAIVFWH